MRFTIEPRIFELFPGLRIAVVVADGIDNRRPNPTVSAAWEAAWQDAGRHFAYDHARSHPHIAVWRERWQALGISVKKFPSSVEALLRRALKGGEPFRIHPLVDFYNAVSLRHVIPAGGFDLGVLEHDHELRLTREGDTFHALDEQTPEPVPAGEVAYVDGSEVLTRHFVWRQSKKALLQPSTERVFLVSEALGGLDPELVERVREDLVAGLSEHFGVEPRSWVLDAERPAVELEG